MQNADLGPSSWFTNLPFRFIPGMVTWALCWEQSKSLFHCTDVFTAAEYTFSCPKSNTALLTRLLNAVSYGAMRHGSCKVWGHTSPRPPITTSIQVISIPALVSSLDLGRVLLCLMLRKLSSVSA